MLFIVSPSFLIVTTAMYYLNLLCGPLSLSLPSSWTRHPLLVTGDTPDMVRHHRLTPSFPLIPAVPCLRLTFPDQRQSIFSTSLMERVNLGSRSKCTVVPSPPGLSRHSLRRKQSTVFLRSTRRRVILYRPSQPRFVFFFLGPNDIRLSPFSGDWSYPHRP